jgi:DNA-nicking Smr family endonuclease
MSRRVRRSSWSRGGKPPVFEAVLDLHGASQEAAYQRLKLFLSQSYKAHRRCVLIIVGKGSEKDPAYEPAQDPLSPERGILRRVVPLWLDTPDLQHFITGYKEALPRHGGRGALYLWIRRTDGHE